MNIKELQKKVYNMKRRFDPEIIEAEKRAERKKGLIKGVALGSFVAGVTTLFLSPDTGANNRKKAKQELEKAKELLETNIADGKEKISQIYEDTKEVIEEKTNVLKEKLSPNNSMNIIDEETIEDMEEELYEEEYDI